MNENYETLSKSKLKKIVTILGHLGVPQKKIESIILLVPFKRGKGPAKSDVIEAIAAEERSTPSETRQLAAVCRGWDVGCFVRLGDLVGDYFQIEGDQCLVLPEDGSFWHGQDIVYFAPEDLAIQRGWFSDGYGHSHRSIKRLIADLL